MANIDTTQSALPAGTVLKGGNASYTLLKTLGQGSFGITYLAKNIVGEDEVEQLFVSVSAMQPFFKSLCLLPLLQHY